MTIDLDQLNEDMREAGCYTFPGDDGGWGTDAGKCLCATGLGRAHAGYDDPEMEADDLGTVISRLCFERESKALPEYFNINHLDDFGIGMALIAQFYGMDEEVAK